MKNVRIGIASAGLALALTASSLVWAGEKDDAAFAKAPAVVQAAAKKALGDKKLEEFGKESIGDKIIYEVGFKVDKVDHAYIIGETGELLQEEADVEVSSLPEAVVATVKKAQPDGKIDEAALATAGDKKFYEVEVKVGKVTHAIKVSLEGKQMADEIVKSLAEEKKPAPAAKG